jgi:hypothetical protein
MGQQRWFVGQAKAFRKERGRRIELLVLKYFEVQGGIVSGGESGLFNRSIGVVLARHIDDACWKTSIVSIHELIKLFAFKLWVTTPARDRGDHILAS